MRRGLFTLLVLLWFPGLAETRAQTCPETSGTHRFSHQGELIDIPILVSDCQAIALELHWSNGRNNGGNFKVTLLDTNGRQIFVKQLSAFQSGHFELPFSTLEPRRLYGMQSIVAVPASVTIQAVRPFAFPASLSYTITRVASPPRSRPLLDQHVANKLQISAGRMLLSGQSSLDGSAGSINYRLEEVQLPEPRTLEIRRQKVTLQTAFRLVLTGDEIPSGVELIWIDDAALPAFRRRSNEVGALIFDRAVLRPDARISISEPNGRLQTFSNPLTLPAELSDSLTRSEKDNTATSGNTVAAIREASRTIGTTKQSLVQIELATDHPFPASQAALQLQIGKRIFLDEVTGDHSGRRLTVTLTPEMFAELKQGAEIFAFFGRPDHSGFADENLWRFGRLDKEMLKR